MVELLVIVNCSAFSSNKHMHILCTFYDYKVRHLAIAQFI